MTAVEYLIEELNGKGLGNISISIPSDLISRVKKMEQFQVEEAFLNGKKEIIRVLNHNLGADAQITGAEYYKKTYGL